MICSIFERKDGVIDRMKGKKRCHSIICSIFERNDGVIHGMK